MRRPLVRNLRGVLILLAALLLSLVPTLYSNRLYAYLPPVLILLLAAGSVLCTLFIRRKVGFRAEEQTHECRRGDDVPLALTVRNDARLTCPRAKADLYVSDLLHGRDTVTPAYVTLAARSSADFAFDVGMNHIGQYRAGLRGMELYDFFGLFCFPIKGRKDMTVTVLPREKPLADLSLRNQMLTEAPSRRKHQVSDGFDYTGVREYAIGDSMKRIHWKLSARTEGYMTKVTETGMRNDLSVLLDVSAPKGDGETLACLYDALIETALAALSLAARQESEYALLYPDKSGAVCKLTPKTQADQLTLIREIAVIGGAGKSLPDGAELVRIEQTAYWAGSNLLVVTAKPTEALLRALISVKQQRRNPMLLYVIPYGSDRNAQKALAAPLRRLDDYGILYDLIPADGGETAPRGGAKTA